jgi:hypothetical protein
MDGTSFVDLLLQQFKCENDHQLSKRLGVAPPTIGNWRTGGLSKTVVKNALNSIKTSMVAGSIKPIVEFHPLDLFHGHKIDNLKKRINDKNLVDKLQAAKGIYSFYDSQAHIIYFGKTTKNLLTEMSQAYGLARPGYRRKRVDGTNFKFVSLTIRETAAFLSAYEIDVDLISNLEAFVTRMVPNNIINRRTENFR